MHTNCDFLNDHTCDLACVKETFYVYMGFTFKVTHEITRCILTVTSLTITPVILHVSLQDFLHFQGHIIAQCIATN